MEEKTKENERQPANTRAREKKIGRREDGEETARARAAPGRYDKIKSQPAACSFRAVGDIQNR